MIFGSGIVSYAFMLHPHYSDFLDKYAKYNFSGYAKRRAFFDSIGNSDKYIVSLNLVYLNAIAHMWAILVSLILKEVSFFKTIRSKYLPVRKIKILKTA
jgi:hypothetical protein